MVKALASHQCGPGSNPGISYAMWVEFVVGSLLCYEKFFSGCSGFPLSSKTDISKFQFNQESVNEKPLCGCRTSKSLFQYLFYLFIWVTNSSPFFEKTSKV